MNATIKLKMRDVAGATVVVTRKMNSTQSKKKLQMKTLESLIEKDDPINPGKKISISSKCADLDKEV